jgi:hypothetical protein
VSIIQEKPPVLFAGKYHIRKHSVHSGPRKQTQGKISMVSVKMIYTFKKREPKDTK